MVVGSVSNRGSSKLDDVNIAENRRAPVPRQGYLPDAHPTLISEAPPNAPCLQLFDKRAALTRSIDHMTHTTSRSAMFLAVSGFVICSIVSLAVPAAAWGIKDDAVCGVGDTRDEPGDLPVTASPVVGGVRLPLGHPALDGLFWITDDWVDTPYQLWAELAERFSSTGLLAHNFSTRGGRTVPIWVHG